MPIEIRELQIKAVVQDAQSASGKSTTPQPAAGTEAIIAACVEQVLEILQQKNER